MSRWVDEKMSSTNTTNLPIYQSTNLAKLSPREIFFCETESAELEKAVGKICAEEITFYPPGIPVINRGEIITEEILNYICEVKKIGGRIIGAADKNLATIKIKKSST